jgi:hypothetical protein
VPGARTGARTGAGGAGVGRAGGPSGRCGQGGAEGSRVRFDTLCDHHSLSAFHHGFPRGFPHTPPMIAPKSERRYALLRGNITITRQEASLHS